MDTIIKAIQQLLKNASAQEGDPLYDIKRVFYGDPILIPESDLPSIAVQPIETEYEMRGNRYDQKNHTVDIRLIYNVKSFFGKSALGKEKVFSIEDAIKKIESSNTSHSTEANTVCGTIQKNTSLPYTKDGTTVNASELARVLTVTYAFSKDRGFPTFEVTVRVRAIAIGDR